MTNDERRYNAGRPYYRPRNKYEVTKKEDKLFIMGISIIILAALVLLVLR
jgi:hypothetical protein